MPSRWDEYEDAKRRAQRQRKHTPMSCAQCHRQFEDLEFPVRFDSWSGKWLCNQCWSQVAPKYRIPRFDGWE
jgi:hypothetical protein